MAWNGSNGMAAQGTAPKKSEAVPKKWHSIFLWLVLGIGITVVVFAVRFSSISEKPESPVTMRKSAAIREVAPAIPKPTEMPLVNNTQKETRKTFPIHTDEFGVRRYPNGTRVFDEKTPMRKPTTPFGDKPIFKNKCLNELASFINLQPGGNLFGTRKYDNQYIRNLRLGLDEEITILKDDDEKTRQTKLAIKEIQEEFKAKSDSEILDIVKDTYTELMRLARYKNDVQKMVKEAAKNTANMTERDYEDLIAAANQMLAKEGIAPIRNTIIVRKNIMINNIKKKREAR